MAFRLSRHASLIRFPARDGVSLEGRYTAAGPLRAAVLCHPHPLHGGSMLSPVVLAVEATFQSLGWTTLAFNFRGVGGSDGAHDGGRAEVGDVLGALDHLAAHDPPPRLAVAGYSFGSVVAGRAAVADGRVDGYLGVAPPLDFDDFAFLRDARCMVSLVGADRDQYASRERLHGLVEALPGPPWVQVVEGADHFFAGALDALAAACREAIVAWDQGQPPSRP